MRDKYQDVYECSATTNTIDPHDWCIYVNASLCTNGVFVETTPPKEDAPRGGTCFPAGLGYKAVCRVT